MPKRKVELSLNPCALKGPDRGGRSSRLGMVVKLFVMCWAPTYAFFQFLAMLGLVIGAGTIFLGAVGGIAVVVFVGWFLINIISDGSFWGDKNYRQWRAEGGDPYFDWTWFAPLNTDSDDLRYKTAGTLNCPNCKQVYPKRYGCFCPHCDCNTMDFVTCSVCQTANFDPDRTYEKPCGFRCTGCNNVVRTPIYAHLPVPGQGASA